MRVFALGDTHLSFGKPKPMHIFGEHWRDHAAKIEAAWREIGDTAPADVNPEEDVLILAGDLSWAMRPDEARPDAEWISRLRGRKVVIRGNHDYWWNSLAKVRALLGDSVEPLQASCTVIDRVAFVGTRGWQCPGAEPSTDAFERMEAAKRRERPVREYTAEDRKIYDRELIRLRLGLEQAQKRRAEFDKLVVILHYPPMNGRHEPSGFTDLLAEFQADWCVYGHLHGDSIATGFNGKLGPTEIRLVSADSIAFRPFRIL
jgi:uncharacterized protein